MFTTFVSEMKGSACARKRAEQAQEHKTPGPLGRLLDGDGDIHSSLPAFTVNQTLAFLTGALLKDYPTDIKPLRESDDHWHALLLNTVTRLDSVLRNIHSKVMTPEGHIIPEIQAAINALFDEFSLEHLDWEDSAVHRQILFAFMQNWQLALEKLNPFLTSQQQWFARLATQLFSSHPLIEAIHHTDADQKLSAKFVADMPAGPNFRVPGVTERFNAIATMSRLIKPDPHPDISDDLRAWAIADPAHLRAAAQDTHTWAYLSLSSRTTCLERALGSEFVKQQLHELRNAWHRAVSKHPDTLLHCSGQSALLINCIILAIASADQQATSDYTALAEALRDAASSASSEGLITLRNTWARELNAAGMHPEFGVPSSAQRTHMQHERALLRFAEDPDGSRAAMIQAYQWLDMVCSNEAAYAGNIRDWVPKARLAEFDTAAASPTAFASKDVSRALRAAHLCVAAGSGDTPATYLDDSQDPLLHLNDALRTAGIPETELAVWHTRVITAFTPAMVYGMIQPMTNALEAANTSGAQSPQVSLCFRPPGALRHRNGARRTGIFTYAPTTKALSFTMNIRMDYLNVEDPRYSPQMIIPFEVSIRHTYRLTKEGRFVETGGTLLGPQAECFAELMATPSDYTAAIIEKGWLKPMLGCEAECAALADAPKAFGWQAFHADLEKALAPTTPDTHRRKMLDQIGADNATIYRGLCTAATTADSALHATLLVNLLFAVAKLACVTRSVYPELQRSIDLVGLDDGALSQATIELGTIILSNTDPQDRLDQLIQWRSDFCIKRMDLYEAQLARERTNGEIDALADHLVVEEGDSDDESVTPDTPAMRVATRVVAELNRGSTFRRLERPPVIERKPPPLAIAGAAAERALTALRSTRTMGPEKERLAAEADASAAGND